MANKSKSKGKNRGGRKNPGGGVLALFDVAGREIGKAVQNRNKSLNKAPNPPLKSIRDKGDSAPVAKSFSYRNLSPKIKRISAEEIEISHTELVDPSIQNSTSFTTAGFQYQCSINPGQALCFPWLSTQAVGWEFYKFRELEYIYIATTGTSTAGNVMMAFDYDAADTLPQTETILSSYAGFSEGVVWDSLVCKANISDMNAVFKERYVRTGSTLPVNNVSFQPSAINTFDSGQFMLYTDNGANTNAIGKLFASYKVRFRCPTLPSGGSITSTEITLGGSGTAALPYGPNPVIAPGSNGVYPVVSGGSNYFILPQVGTYIMVISFTGTGITNSPAFNNASNVTINLDNAIINAAATSYLSYGKLVTSSPNAYFSIVMTGLATTIGASSLNIAMVGYSPV